MLKNSIRICDVCEDEIPKGETYAFYLVETPEGQVRMDICVDCRMNMGGREMRSAVN